MIGQREITLWHPKSTRRTCKTTVWPRAIIDSRLPLGNLKSTIAMAVVRHDPYNRREMPDLHNA